MVHLSGRLGNEFVPLRSNFFLGGLHFLIFHGSNRCYKMLKWWKDMVMYSVALEIKRGKKMLTVVRALCQKF